MSIQYRKDNSGIAVKVVYYTKDKIIAEQTFGSKVTLGQVLDYFSSNLRKGNFSPFNNYYLNGEKLNNSDILTNIFNEPNSNLVELDLALEINESPERSGNTRFDSEIYEKIMKPSCNPFRLTIFSPKTNSYIVQRYPNEFVQELGLDTFSDKSAYCNSPDALFISGGDKFNLSFNDFWIINQNDLNVTRRKMPVVKRKHSMLYLPNGIVFIAGGDNLKTLYYDLSSDKFVKWADMNEKHESPALYFDGEYLYVFNALTKQKNYFEKTKLDFENQPEWEKVYPQFEGVGPTEFFENSFGVCEARDGNVLFVGGNESNFNIFTYNIAENVITVTGADNENIPLNEKTFYKINDSINIALPADFESCNKIAVVDTNECSLRRIPVENNRSRGLSSNSDRGEVSVKAKFCMNGPRGQSMIVRSVGKPVFNFIESLQGVKKVNIRSGVAVPGNLNQIKENYQYRGGNNYYYEKTTNEEYYYGNSGNTIDQNRNYQRCACGCLLQGNNNTGNTLRSNNFAYTQNTSAPKYKICACCGELYEVQEKKGNNMLRMKNPEVSEQLIEKDGKVQLVVKNFVKLDDEPVDDLLDYAYPEGGDENVNYVTFKKNQVSASENKLIDNESNIIKLPFGM